MKKRDEIEKFVMSHVKLMSDEADLHAQSHFYHVCGFDSLDVAELMVAFEEEYKMKFKKDPSLYKNASDIIEEIYRN